MRKFFNEPATGPKADIARHQQKEKELEAKVKECERKVESDPSDEMAAASLKTYRFFLDLLRDSKAEVVSAIGRKGSK